MYRYLFAVLSLCTHAASAQPDSTLVKQLDRILSADQSVRIDYDALPEKFKGDTMGLRKAITAQAAVMQRQDSLNFLHVSEILDTYGWPGADMVSEQGSRAIFLVVQHADLQGQQKYLPLMRDAVARGKAQGEDLALLEDRVLLRTGKHQLYGSQVGGNMLTGEHYVLPLADPDNVDKRRAGVGLEPLASYLSTWNLQWDAAEYKKRLPALEQQFGIK